MRGSFRSGLGMSRVLTRPPQVALGIREASEAPFGCLPSVPEDSYLSRYDKDVEGAARYTRAAQKAAIVGKSKGAQAICLSCALRGFLALL